MGQQIIEQPDGKYAVFSSVVDSWILIDATREEIADHFAERAAERSRWDTEREFRRIDEGIRYAHALTFDEAEELSAKYGGTIADIREGRDV